MGSSVHLTDTEKETKVIMKQFACVCVQESLRDDRQRGSVWLRNTERMRVFYLDVTLCSQVVYFCGFDFIDNFHQACAISQVPIVQLHVYDGQNKILFIFT